MITLISDLHLSDSTARSTINVPRLLQHLSRAFAYASEKKVEKLTLVLLGDIFEVLKSEVWLERSLRPWEACAPAHDEAVAEIIRRIIGANEEFFVGLQEMQSAYGSRLRMVYVPGNHDRPLHTEMGVTGRGLIRSKLPALNAGAEVFSEKFSDEEHALVAEHGHEWDPENRVGAGLAAVGDAVVIEFVLRLPVLVRKRLGAAADDDSIDFLYEFDNVRPHSPEVLLQWIGSNIALRRKKTSPDVQGEIKKALKEILGDFIALKDRVAFGSFDNIERRVDVLLRVVKGMTGHIENVASLLPAEAAMSPYPSRALDELLLQQRLGGDYCYFVCGHTHDPLVVPLDTGASRADRRVPVYFNTGTWRRVRRIAGDAPSGAPVKTFSCWDEECVVNIYSQDDQGLGFPQYEFYRLTSGAHV